MLGAKKSVDDLGDEVKQLDHELDKLPTDATKAAAAMKLLSGDVESVGKHVDDLGTKNSGLAALDSKIRETQKEVRKLADEFVKTGDVDVFRKLGDAEGRLRGLRDTRKALADAIIPDGKDVVANVDGLFKRIAGRAEEWGNKIGGLLPASISGALSTPVAGPIIAAALLAVLASVTAIILANVGGLVLAAGGAGLVGAGIVGAILGNPEVVGAAWKREFSGFKDELMSATNVFRDPMLDAAHEFGAVIRGIDFDHIFARAAEWMPGLIKGAALLVQYLGEAAESLADGAGPAMEALTDELPKIGLAIKTAVDSIAAGGEGGATALRDLLQIIEVVIVGLGKMIQLAENTYTAFDKIRHFAFPDSWLDTNSLAPLQQVGRTIGDVGSEAQHTVDDLNALSSKLNETAVSADTLAAGMVDKLFTTTMNIDQAVLGFAESLTRLDEVMDRNGKTIDIHTAKGQANREAILNAVTANMRLYQAQVAAGMSAEDAAQDYDSNTGALIRQLRQAGLTAAQVDELIGKYKNIPDTVNTTIAMEGLTKAISQLDETLRLINGLHDRTITVTVKQVGDLPRGQSRGAGWATGGIRRAQTGMVVPPSDPGTILMGEPQTGGEALIPLRGISQPTAMGLLNTAGAGYGLSVSPNGGGMPQQIVIHATFIDPMSGETIRQQVITAAANRGMPVGTYLAVS